MKKLFTCYDKWKRINRKKWENNKNIFFLN